LLAFVIFFMVKAINTARAKMDLAAPPPKTPEDIELLREIRDSLKK
jgi:large conductance mechanosensitive channel